MCESYDKMFDALVQLPTDQYLTLGALLSKAMIEGSGYFCGHPCEVEPFTDDSGYSAFATRLMAASEKNSMRIPKT